MNYKLMLCRAIDFIEANLQKAITPEDVSRHAFYSIAHLYRVFRSVLGCSIKEYIARRRLSVSAQTLLSTKRRVIDVAMDMGYESPETFLRAFRKLYGSTPSQFRRTSQQASLFPVPDLKYLEDMTPRLFPEVVYQRAIPISGPQIITSLKNQKNVKDLPQFWEKLRAEGFLDNFGPDESFYGVYCQWKGEDDFTFKVGRHCDGPGHFLIPQSQYAVFTMSPFDPGEVVNFWNLIYGQWFIKTGIERAQKLVDFETYSQSFQTYRVYIPLES